MKKNKINEIEKGMLQREKTWDELTDQERIERLRQKLRQFRWIERDLMALRKEVRQLRAHEHLNGKVLIEAEADVSYGSEIVADDHWLDF